MNMLNVERNEVSSAGPSLTLDELAAMESDQLERLYRDGKAPASLAAVDGALRGRMLAVRKLEKGPIAGWLRRFAGSRAFLWSGKTFEAASARKGRGINRIQAPGVLGRQNLFPFETRIDASEIDGKDTVVLDYDLGENPAYIRRVHDEIREVSPGVFLGPAMWKTKTRPVTVLWFALAAGRP
jgi:hypothetical protein